MPTYQVLINNQVDRTIVAGEYYRKYYNLDTAIAAETKSVQHHAWAIASQHPNAVVSMACLLP